MGSTRSSPLSRFRRRFSGRSRHRLHRSSGRTCCSCCTGRRFGCVRRRRRFAQPATSFLSGFALQFLGLSAAFVLFPCSGFGGIALCSLGNFFCLAARGVLFLGPAIFFFATLGVHERVHARIPLMIGKFAQNHTGPLCRRALPALWP